MGAGSTSASRKYLLTPALQARLMPRGCQLSKMLSTLYFVKSKLRFLKETTLGSQRLADTTWPPQFPRFCTRCTWVVRKFSAQSRLPDGSRFKVSYILDCFRRSQRLDQDSVGARYASGPSMASELHTTAQRLANKILGPRGCTPLVETSLPLVPGHLHFLQATSTTRQAPLTVYLKPASKLQRQQNDLYLPLQAMPFATSFWTLMGASTWTWMWSAFAVQRRFWRTMTWCLT